jgi:hypothetical protein
MPDSASVPGLAGVPLARGASKTDPYRVKLSPNDEQDFVSWLIQEIRAAEEARTKVIQEHGLIDYWHELYEQTPQDLSVVWPDAANLSSWLPVESRCLAGAATQVVFGRRPFARSKATARSQQRCAKVESFHEWKAKTKAADVVRPRHSYQLIEGNGVLECSEQRLIRKFHAQAKVHAVTDEFGAVRLDADGQLTPKRGDDGQLDLCDEPDCQQPAMTVQYHDQVAVCDGPQYRVLSMKDFLFLPGHARDASEVWGFAKRVWLRLPELEQRQAAGFYRNIDRLGTEGDRLQREDQTRQGVTLAPQTGVTAEKELWEVHLFYDIDDDGVEEWLIATVSTAYGVCVRLEHDALRQVRFVSVTPFPRADSVYGYSFVGHKIASVAEEHAALRNQIADRGALATNAPIKRLKDGYWNPDDQPWGPNAVIEVARMDEIQQQIIQDVPQSTVFQKRDCEEAAERISGLNDQSVIGAGSLTQITATQVQQEAHASFVRIDEPVHHLQEAMAELYQLRHEIWRRSLLAHDEGVRPHTSVLRGLQTMGLTMPAEGTFAFTAEDLTGHFSFVPKGSVETADKYRMRDDYNLFVSQALPALMKLSPGLMQQMQQNPKIGEALFQKACHLYGMDEVQAALTTGGPPMPAPPATAGMPPPGVPGRVSARLAMPGMARPAGACRLTPTALASRDGARHPARRRADPTAMTTSATVTPCEDGTAPDRERDDLVALLASPGWRLFCDYVAAWWHSEPLLKRLESLILTTEVPSQHETCAQILASRRAVHTVMSWPKTRIHALTTPVAPRRPTRPRRVRA